MRLALIGCAVLVSAIASVVVLLWHPGPSASGEKNRFPLDQTPKAGRSEFPRPVAATGSLSPKGADSSLPQVAQPGIGLLPDPPASLVGFWSWSADRREQAVTLIQRDASWTFEVRAFMLQALQVKTLPLVTRNNMAAGLLRQAPPSSEFESLLVSMSEDETEDPEWRNYTVQFMAEALPNAADRPRLEHALRVIAAQETKAWAATAVLHLARLGAAGTVTLDADFDRQVLAMAQNERLPTYARSTALAVAGERRIAGVLELARALALPGESSDVRRAAIGVLGSSTELNDGITVQRYASDPDPSVKRVAQANLGIK